MTSLYARFIKSGGHFNSPIGKVLEELDKTKKYQDLSEYEFILLIRSIRIELDKLNYLEVGLRSVDNMVLNSMFSIN